MNFAKTARLISYRRTVPGQIIETNAREAWMIRGDS